MGGFGAYASVWLEPSNPSRIKLMPITTFLTAIWTAPSEIISMAKLLGAVRALVDGSLSCRALRPGQRSPIPASAMHYHRNATLV